MILAAFLMPGIPVVPQAPPWLDRSMAGYRVSLEDSRRTLGVYDAKRNFYLVRTAECDGAHLSVTLTQDRHVVFGSGYNVPGFKQERGYGELDIKSLSNLATGRGIQIGDDELILRKRLGRATSVVRTGNRSQFVNHRYVWRNVKNGQGEIWTNEYIFKRGRLIEIQFARNLVPGC